MLLPTLERLHEAAARRLQLPDRALPVLGYSGRRDSHHQTADQRLVQ